MIKFTTEMAEHPQSHLMCNLTLFFHKGKNKKRNGVFKIKAYSTEYSQAVTHPSTNSAQCYLTSVIDKNWCIQYGKAIYKKKG